MKTNKNGVKLLAAALVLVMAFAAFAVVGSSDSDADIGSPANISPAPADAPTALGTGTAYIVKSDMSIDVGESDVATTIYVVDGVTVTLTGNDSTGALTKQITIVAASADGKKSISDDTNIVITGLKAGDISIKASFSGSSQKASSFTVTGQPTVETSIAITLGTIDVNPVGTVSVGANGLSVTGMATAIDNLSYGSALDANATTNVFDYTAVGANRTFDLVESDSLVIKNGTYTVSNYNNTIKFTKYVGSTTITGTATGNATTISASTADEIGSISIIKGEFSGTINSKAFSGILNNTTSKYINSIPASSASTVAYIVKGVYEQKTSINDTSDFTVTVAMGATLIIPENVSVKIGTFVDNTDSITKVFGTLDASTGSTTGDVFSGAFGTVINGSYKADGNSNVTSGDDKGISGDVSGTIGDAILVGNAVIPAGQTLTVTGNLGLNKNSLTINGTLIIESGAVIYTAIGTEEIVLGSTGKIVNNGSLGTIENIVVADTAETANKITISGITGAQFGYATVYSGDSVLAISGDIKTSGIVKDLNGNDKGTITLAEKSALAGDLTIGYGVTLTGVAGTEAAADADIVIDGIFTGNVKLGYGASIAINGMMGIGSTVKAYQGSIDGSGLVSGVVVLTNSGTGEATAKDYITGFAVYSEKTSKSVTVNVSGSITDAVTQENSNKPTVTITGKITVPENGLVISKDLTSITMGASGNTITLVGTLMSEDPLTSVEDYIGAKYTTRVETTTPATTVTFFTNLLTAMENIETAQNKTVTAIIKDLSDVITVSAGERLNITITGEVKKGASIIAEKDSKMTMNASASGAKLTGSIVVYKGVNCTVNFAQIDATIVSDEKTVYAGFVTAVDMASAGDTLTVGSVTSDESLTIKDGITLVADSLTVKGNLTIPETSTLKATTIAMQQPVAGTDAKVNVLGTLDLSAGSITGSYELKSTGKTILTSVDTSKMSGAYYTVDEGLVLTTVENAVENATEGEIVIVGKISEKTDIALSGVDLRILFINNDIEASLGTITLENAKVIAQGKLTATIVSNATTTTTGAADASISISGAVITVQDIETGLQINNVSGKVNVLSGVVSVAGAAAIADANSELNVAEGAQALVSGSLNATTGKITVNGELAVKGTFTSTITPTINGTLTAISGATVSMDGANIAGSLIAEDSTAFTINGNGFVILATGEVAGEFTFTGNKYLKAMAGADVEDMDLGITVTTTTFYVNGDALETYYSIGTNPITSVANSILADVNAIPELKTSSALVWKQADGSAAPNNLGEKSALYTTVGLATVKVTVSVGTGISLWVDGIKYASGSEPELIIGEHNVSATINPGYKGTTTITFNGATVSNGKISITADMIGGTNEVLSVIGDISIDSGDTPVTPVEPEKDDGMGITDYLLIVLVVLAAILVVIVAIRMMRS